MPHAVFVITLVISVMLGVPQRGAAQTPAPPTIHNVTLHENAGVLTITGTGFGRAPRVTIAGQPATVLSGGTDTQIDVLAPAALLTTPGSYRLTLMDPVRQVGDAFVVASHAAVAVRDVTAVLVTGAAPAAGEASLTGAVVTSVPRSLNGPAPMFIEDSGPPYRTALGYQALLNTSGSYNTGTGFQALRSNTTGPENTASGGLALYSNTTGRENTAIGTDALRSNTTADYNTASGSKALYSNTTGTENTAIGAWALFWATGSYNTALGADAGFNATTGSYNLFLGENVMGTAADTNTIRIGLPYNGTVGQNRTFIAGIRDTQLTGSAVQVFIDANGQLGTVTPGVQSGTIDVPIGELAQQVGEQQAVIADLRARLARLEALMARTTDSN